MGPNHFICILLLLDIIMVLVKKRKFVFSAIPFNLQHNQITLLTQITSPCSTYFYEIASFAHGTCQWALGSLSSRLEKSSPGRHFARRRTFWTEIRLSYLACLDVNIAMTPPDNLPWIFADLLSIFCGLPLALEHPPTVLPPTTH